MVTIHYSACLVPWGLPARSHPSIASKSPSLSPTQPEQNEDAENSTQLKNQLSHGGRLGMLQPSAGVCTYLPRARREAPSHPCGACDRGWVVVCKADCEVLSVQVVQGDARPGPNINGQGFQGSWLGKARSFGFSGAQSQPGPEEPLQAAHPAPAAVLSR